MNLQSLVDRSSRGQPIGWRIRQWTATARLRPPKDRPAGVVRRPSVRYLAAASSLPRMRLQDTDPFLRNGVHPARIGCRQQQT